MGKITELKTTECVQLGSFIISLLFTTPAIAGTKNVLMITLIHCNVQINEISSDKPLAPVG